MANLIGNTAEPDVAGVLGQNTNDTDKAGPGVHGVSKAVGVWGESATWHGVAGFSQSTTGGFGVFGANTTGGTGVVGESKGWMGVFGKSESTTGGAGVMGEGNPAAGVIGKSTQSHGVFGETSEPSSTPIAAGVWGEHKGNGSGVVGVSKNGAGVFGKGGQGAGVVGDSQHFIGVLGESHGDTDNCNGVFGICHIAGNAIHGKGGTNAGLFEGTVIVRGGSLQVVKVGDIGGEITADSIFAANKHFRIDHPCDPANKYLCHTTVESSDMMNVYSGNVITDNAGKATVVLPDYFEALNCDFRYQLTVIGHFAQAVVASEIIQNCFRIETDRPNVKVSWQVAGVRKDAYAKANPMLAEQNKPEAERGFYLHPQLYGQPEEKGIAWARNQERQKAHKSEKIAQAAFTPVK